MRIKHVLAVAATFLVAAGVLAQSSMDAKPQIAPKSAPKSAVKKKAKPAPAIDPKILDLQKRLRQTQKKFEVVKASGKPTQNLEDKIYEIEDALRLAGHAG